MLITNSKREKNDDRVQIHTDRKWHVKLSCIFNSSKFAATLLKLNEAKC